MHGTLEPISSLTAERHSFKTKTIALATLAVLVGIAAGAVLVYTPLGDHLLTYLGVTYPKDCG